MKQQPLFVDEEKSRIALAPSPQEKEQIMELMAQAIVAVQMARREVPDDVLISPD